MVQESFKNKKEMERMGWNKKFHIGSDMNQILGEILEKYQNILPKSIYDLLKPLIIVQDKEFPYAISGTNKRTSGDNVRLQLLQLLRRNQMSKAFFGLL